MDRTKVFYMICGAALAAAAFAIVSHFFPQGQDNAVERSSEVSDPLSETVAGSGVRENPAVLSSEGNGSSPAAGVRVSSVPRYNDQLRIAHESFPEGMPLADLMDHGRERWGLNFDRFYREEPVREPWADWEAAARSSLEAYFTNNMKPLGGWTEENAGFKENIVDYVMYRYQMLWEKGVSLADAPTALELMLEGGSIHNKPTLRIDLEHVLFWGDGTYRGGVIRSRTLGGAGGMDYSFHEIIEEGVVPEGLRVIFIDKNGQEKPPGWQPPEIKPPSERAKWMSDEQLRAAAHLFEKDMRLGPEEETAYLARIERLGSRNAVEQVLFSFISAWKERPSAWRLPPPTEPVPLFAFSHPNDISQSTGKRSDSYPVSPSDKSSAPPENRPPRLPPPSAPESAPDDVMDRAPAPPHTDPNAAPSADDLGRMQEAVKRAESGGDLSDEERSLLRLKGLYDLYKAERERLRRGGPASPPFPEEPSK